MSVEYRKSGDFNGGKIVVPPLEIDTARIPRIPLILPLALESMTSILQLDSMLIDFMIEGNMQVSVFLLFIPSNIGTSVRGLLT